MVPKWKALKQQYGRVSPSVLLSLTEQDEPPVDLMAIARELGVRIEVVPELGCAGEAVVTGGAFAAIRVPGTQRGRDRFTIAHEIGHLMLHDFEKDGTADETGRRLLFRDNITGTPGSGRLEVEANAFAAELLMPFSWLEDYGLLAGWHAATLADWFGVSKEAMNIRLERMLGKGWGE